MPLVEQELLTLPEHLSSTPVFSGVCVTRSLVLHDCMFCRSLFVLLYFFFWPLCCLFFFDIWILIAPLVSSNSSYYEWLTNPQIQYIYTYLKAWSAPYLFFSVYSINLRLDCTQSFRMHFESRGDEPVLSSSSFY